MPPVEFEPTIWAGEQPQTYALERAGNGTGQGILILSKSFYINTVFHNEQPMNPYNDSSPATKL
jgi:hypothetical protein